MFSSYQEWLVDLMKGQRCRSWSDGRGWICRPQNRQLRWPDYGWREIKRCSFYLMRNIAVEAQETSFFSNLTKVDNIPLLRWFPAYLLLRNLHGSHLNTLILKKIRQTENFIVMGIMNCLGLAIFRECQMMTCQVARSRVSMKRVTNIKFYQK